VTWKLTRAASCMANQPLAYIAMRYLYQFRADALSGFYASLELMRHRLCRRQRIFERGCPTGARAIGADRVSALPRPGVRHVPRGQTRRDPQENWRV
jgi:hypothetical protein